MYSYLICDIFFTDFILKTYTSGDSSSTFNYIITIIRFFKIIERLYAKPVLTHGAVNQTVLVGKTVRFSCEFLTDMHPYVFWMYFTKDEVVYHDASELNEAYDKELVVYEDKKKIKVVRV